MTREQGDGEMTTGGTETLSGDREILYAAAVILRREAEKDTSPAANDNAELRIAAAVCEAVGARG